MKKVTIDKTGTPYLVLENDKDKRYYRKVRDKHLMESAMDLVDTYNSFNNTDIRGKLFLLHHYESPYPNTTSFLNLVSSHLHNSTKHEIKEKISLMIQQLDVYLSDDNKYLPMVNKNFMVSYTSKDGSDYLSEEKLKGRIIDIKEFYDIQSPTTGEEETELETE